MLAFGKAFIFSNFFIAFCAACFCLSAFVQNDWVPNWEYIALSFTGTWSFYLMLRISSSYKYTLKGENALLRWFAPKKERFLILLGITTAASLYLFFQFDMQVQFILGLAALISIAYGFKFPFFGRRLRSVPLIKTFLVALAWTMVCWMIPACMNGFLDSPEQEVYFQFINRLAFVWAITIPFDIRDMKFDKANEVKTIPMLLGIDKTKLLACSILLLSMVCGLGFFANSFILFLILYLITAYLILITNPKSGEFHYTGLLDSTLALFFLAILLSKIIQA